MNHTIGALLVASLVATGAQADTLSKIKQTGAVSIGVRPYAGALSFALEDGRHGAFQVEVCRWVLAGVKSRLGLSKIAIRYVPVAPESGVALLRSGSIDMECSTSVNTAARQRAASFSMTTYVQDKRMSEPVAIMLRKDDTAFKGVVDEMLVAMMRSGDMADLYHQWVSRPNGPSGERPVRLPNQATLQAWGQPNDRAAEAYTAP